MRYVLADTGPLYAAVDPSDQHHSRAQEETLRLSAAGFTALVGWPTVLEAYTLVVRHLGPQVAHRWLPELLDGTGQIAPSLEDYTAAERHVRGYPDQPITLFDVLLAVLSRRLDLPVWTYDHHFDIMRVPVWR